MPVQRIRLTRDQLSTFLKNYEQIRQFELLFQTVDDMAHSDADLNITGAESTATEALAQIARLVHDTGIVSGNADQKATQALDKLERIANALEMLATAPINDNVSFEYLETFNVSTPSSEDVVPMIPLGTLGQQQVDRVDIKGGVVVAQLKNNQTTLLTSVTTLSSNAGASAGTLLNSPAVGDPSKWVAIDDNGTTRYIPTW